MRSAITLPFLCLLAGAAIADQPTPEEAEILPRILSAVQVELVEDRLGMEIAILLRSDEPDEDMADLVIIAGNPDRGAGDVLMIVRKIVWAGKMAGQSPWLEISPQRSLLVRSEQIGVGRSPWEQTLTLAEREGEIRVAGFTFTQWDRLSAGSAFCDWNLLTGHWTMNYEIPSETGPDRKGESSGQRAMQMPVSEWQAHSRSLPDFCEVDLTQ